MEDITGDPEARGLAHVAASAQPSVCLLSPLPPRLLRLYGLTEEEFAYILITFPLVVEAVKADALEAYRRGAIQS